ncbi:MAG: hypothetical protein HOB82_00555 [Alphaproteobacteria bacterium]|jgi:hypothetical protein|nr:hypothetical protein [Alphaproteobacteria bacterium]
MLKRIPKFALGALAGLALGVGFAQAQDATKVAFPKGYGASADWVRYAVINNTDENTRRDLFAPAGLAEAAASGGPLPAGTVLIMETYKATLDAYKDPIIEADGNFRVGRMDAAWVMEKQDGWAADGGAGDWEFAAFRSTGGRLSSADIDGCHGCHQDAADNDFVFSLGQIIGAGG